jgi:hypothetical protein
VNDPQRQDSYRRWRLSGTTQSDRCTGWNWGAFVERWTAKGGVVPVQVRPKLLPDVEDLDVRADRALRRARTFVREAACAVGGHDYLLQAAVNRIFLRCVDCGHETPGWRVDVRVVARTARSDHATGRRVPSTTGTEP